MDIPQIQSKLEDLFKTYRIIFWNDQEGEFEDSLEDLKLKGVSILRPDKEGQFKTKILLESEKPDKSFLVYTKAPVPDYEDDWLLDIRLYSYQFSADRASILLDEFGLTNHQLREHLILRKKFLANKDRIARLGKLVHPNDSAWELDRKMLAVVVKSEHDDFFDIVRSLYHEIAMGEGLGKPCASWEQMQKLELEEVFWKYVKGSFGYEAEKPTLKNLLTGLFVTDLAYNLAGEVPDSIEHLVFPAEKRSNVSVCMARWRVWSSQSESFEVLSNQIAENLHAEEVLSRIPFEQLSNTETFLAIEKTIIRQLRDRVVQTSETIKADEIIQFAKKRQDKFWASPQYADTHQVPRKAFRAAYDTIIASASFFDLKNQYPDGFKFNSAKEYIEAYCQKLYRFDQLYRQFCEYSDIAEAQGWGLLKELHESIESAYCHWFLGELALEWGKNVKPESWKVEGIDNQYNFYQKHVLPVAGKKESRGRITAYVIISDAFRYEAAEELTRELNSKYRFVADLKSVLGVLPSYTSLGMAALLPHQKLEYGDNGEVLVDGKSSSGLPQRNEILKAHNGLAVKSDELMAMKREDAREFVRELDLLYIYHNTIDSTGDSATTEDKTFQATRRAINELSDVVKYIINVLNGSQIFITADHGFLYTETKPTEISKNKLTSKIDSAVKTKKRYIIGKDLPDIEDSYSGRLSQTAGLDPETDMSFLLPKGLSLFYFTGGAKFVHGGMSLQEVVIPLVIAGRVRGKAAETTKERKVSVQVLGTNHRITTNRHRFQLLQTDAVSDRVKSITLKVAVFEGNKPVTNIESVTFDSSSDNMADRTKWVSLTLQNRDYDRNKTYRLILRDAEDDIEQQSVEVKIDRAFLNDF